MKIKKNRKWSRFGQERHKQINNSVCFRNMSTQLVDDDDVREQNCNTPRQSKQRSNDLKSFQDRRSSNRSSSTGDKSKTTYNGDSKQRMDRSKTADQPKKSRIVKKHDRSNNGLEAGVEPKPGMRIDACDTDGLWSSGQIVKVSKHRREKHVVTISYDGWEENWNETIKFENNQRLSKHGTYSSKFKALIDMIPTKNKNTFWPCIVNIRTPNPLVADMDEYSLAEDMLRVEPNIFIQPYGLTEEIIPIWITPTMKKVGGLWMNATSIKPFESWMDFEKTRRHKSSEKFFVALRMAMMDSKIPSTPYIEFETGTLVKPCFRTIPSFYVPPTDSDDEDDNDGAESDVSLGKTPESDHEDKKSKSKREDTRKTSSNVTSDCDDANEKDEKNFHHSTGNEQQNEIHTTKRRKKSFHETSDSDGTYGSRTSKHKKTAPKDEKKFNHSTCTGNEQQNEIHTTKRRKKSFHETSDSDGTYGSRTSKHKKTAPKDEKKFNHSTCTGNEQQNEIHTTKVSETQTKVKKRKRESRDDEESNNSEDLSKSVSLFSKRNKKPRCTSDGIKEEQENFEECENIFLPIMSKLKVDNLTDSAAQKYLTEINAEIDKLTPPFIKAYQIGLLIKHVRKQFNRNVHLKQLCRQITKEMKRLFIEKDALVPEGFNPKRKRHDVKGNENTKEMHVQDNKVPREVDERDDSSQSQQDTMYQVTTHQNTEDEQKKGSATTSQSNVEGDILNDSKADNTEIVQVMTKECAKDNEESQTTQFSNDQQCSSAAASISHEDMTLKLSIRESKLSKKESGVSLLRESREDNSNFIRIVREKSKTDTMEKNDRDHNVDVCNTIAECSEEGSVYKECNSDMSVSSDEQQEETCELSNHEVPSKSDKELNAIDKSVSTMSLLCENRKDSLKPAKSPTTEAHHKSCNVSSKHQLVKAKIFHRITEGVVERNLKNTDKSDTSTLSNEEHKPDTSSLSNEEQEEIICETSPSNHKLLTKSDKKLNDIDTHTLTVPLVGISSKTTKSTAAASDDPKANSVDSCNTSSKQQVSKAHMFNRITEAVVEQNRKKSYKSNTSTLSNEEERRCEASLSNQDLISETVSFENAKSDMSVSSDDNSDMSVSSDEQEETCETSLSNHEVSSKSDKELNATGTDTNTSTISVLCESREDSSKCKKSTIAAHDDSNSIDDDKHSVDVVTLTNSKRLMPSNGKLTYAEIFAKFKARRLQKRKLFLQKRFTKGKN